MSDRDKNKTSRSKTLLRAKQTQNTQAGQERKKIYLVDKKRLLEKEKDNYTKLMVLKCPDGWWKMFGHSAIFYKYKIADSLKVAARLLPDTDYDVVSEEGYIAIDDVERLKNKLKVLRIYPSNITERGWTFDLGERVTEQDYVLMLHEEDQRLERANRLITVNEHLAELNAKVKAVHKIVHECVRKMDGVSREVFAVDAERRVAELQVMLVRTARGSMKVDVCLKRAYDVAEELYGYIMIMMNLRLLEAKKIYELTEAVVSLEKQIKGEIRKRALDRADQEVEKIIRKNDEEE